MTQEWPTHQWDLQWKTNFSSETCVMCAAMHGQVFRQGSEPLLPVHPRCRCEYVHVPHQKNRQPVDWYNMNPNARELWVMLVVHLLATGQQVPGSLLPLVGDAKDYMEEHGIPRKPQDPALKHTKGPPPMPTDPRLHLTTGSLLQTASGDADFRCRFIRAGRVRHADNSPGPFSIRPDALATAVANGQFTGLSAFVDHADYFESPSLRNLAGRTLSAEWNEGDQAVDGTIRLFDTNAGQIIARLFDQVLADADEGLPTPDLGLSLVFWPELEPIVDEDEAAVAPGQSGQQLPSHCLAVTAFRHIESVDFVFQPAADGRVKEALTALRSCAPSAANLLPDPDFGDAATAGQPRIPRAAGPPAANVPKTEGSNLEPTRSEIMPPKSTDAQPEPVLPQEGTPPEAPTDESPSQATPVTAAAHPANPNPAWQEAMRVAAIDNILVASGLPAATQAFLRSQNYQTPEELQAAIETQSAHIAELRSDQVVQIGDTPPRSSGISLGRTSLDQVRAAFEAFVEGNAPPTGVQPISGLRELYHLLSGDYEMYGLFNPDRVYLANVNSSTMAGLVANALNKSVINAFQVYPKWWSPLVTIQDFTNLQQVKWITLGGIGELPTVAEGAAYTELTWDDQTETADFVKKGGYLGITLEAIDKDDVGQLRAAPRALAQAAWLTLSKSVSDIFTSNSGVGPTMADSVALFHAVTHGNLLTTALSWSEWGVVRTAMQKQTELNSGERLGGLTAPKYLIVPIDLETTALQVLASEGEPGTADNDINPMASGNSHDALLNNARRRVIVCPLWTDTNDWAAAADPMLYPVIGLGFRYGRTPEIFSVASPTAGLMFTNDTLPVKVRYFYAVGPTDWRGLHKSNVS